MTRSFYITTPIYYVNAEPHLGHAYTTILADTARRYHLLLGDEARMQTGTDEHGDKIAEAAAKLGIEPKAYADMISGKFRASWGPLNIEPDNFIRTTDPDHVHLVRTILQKVHDAGDIYFAKYGGLYCVGCERFYTERELVDGKCPDHKSDLKYVEEENYFFRMSKYQDWLVKHLEHNPEFVRPERYKNEVLAMLREPLEDLCISRPKSRLTWGISLPFDDNYVTYVWFDALLNYITGLGWPDDPKFARFWPAAQHLIAKDILKPHAIFWPTMLKAAGFEPYQRLNVHGYWNVGQTKMSKSLGNVVAPLDLAQVYGPEPFRYFLMREMSFGLDANFSEELLVERYNADLANDLGNLYSRVLNMLARYRDGVLPAPGGGEPTEEDRRLYSALEGLKPGGEHDYAHNMKDFHFDRALFGVWHLISLANKYVVATEPWELAKSPEASARLNTVLHNLMQSLCTVAHLIWPVMPRTAEAMCRGLGGGLTVPPDWEDLYAFKLLAPGSRAEKPEPLFPRVDTDKVKAKAAKAEAKAEHKPEAKTEPKAAQAKEQKPSRGPAASGSEEISIEDFGRIELKVGLILEAEPVKKADRLLHLTVDLGEETPRSIVAGIAQHYRPEELPGKKVVVVANLKPTKLKGVLSQGMVLAASGVDGGLKLVNPEGEAAPGTKVK